MEIIRSIGTQGLRALMKIYDSEDLFKGEKQILIRHGEALYRLLITRQGKLVLNK